MESPVVTSAGMRAAEEAAFNRGVSAETLMAEAAAGIARTVVRFFPVPGRCILFAGKGNNAGDAFAAAKLLHDRGWQIEWRSFFADGELSELALEKLRSLRAALEGDASAVAAGLKASMEGDAPSSSGGARGDDRALPSRTVILDGLLGLGAKRPLRDPIRTACRQINQLRTEHNAFVFAIDLPTGLEGDSGATDEDCVIADVTVTIGCAKRGLVVDTALRHVGRLEVVELPGLAADLPSLAPAAVISTAASLRHLLPRRSFDAYKNQFGRVGVVAGSRGLTGAAVLCALGALRGGAGLLRVYVLEEIYAIVAGSAPPEAMVQPVADYGRLMEEPVDVWAVGPGLGRANAVEIRRLIEQSERPMVLDADGLNIVADDIAILQRCAGPRLLTPHPGEMKRLAPNAACSRGEIVGEFCERFPVTLLLKGSRTIVGERSRPHAFNTTGNPGMSTGGMGDVLTGVCAALLGQKLAPYDAARLAAWLCGRAAEIAIFDGGASEESLLPSDVLENLGAAFRDLHASGAT